MNLQMLFEGWTGSRESLLKKNGVGVNEAKGDKLRESSAFVLDSSQHQDLIHPMGGGFRMPVHQRGSRANATGVSRPDDFLPLRDGDLIAGKHAPDFVIEDFGCGTGERIEPIITQHGEIVAQRHTGELHAINDLHRRKSMYMHARHGCLHGPQNISVIVRIKAAWQAALNAYLGGTDLRGVHRLARNFFRSVEVDVFLARAPAESAELAANEANVGEVDVPVYDVGNEVANQLRP